MKKFFLFIIILLLLFIIWLLLGKNVNINNLINKTKQGDQNVNTQKNLSSDKQKADKTDDSSNQNSENQENEVKENNTKKQTCFDTGCPAGNYCADNGKCQPNLKFKPIPNLSDSLQNSFKNLSAISNFDINIKPIVIRPNKSKTIGAEATSALATQGMLISLSEKGSVGKPRIFGNKIVFVEYVNAIATPFVYDINSNKLEKITYSGDVFDIDIGSKGIVWDDFERGGGGRSDIHYLNPVTNEEGYISPRTNYQDHPKIFGNAIIWAEQLGESDGFALYSYWLPSGEENRIKRLKPGDGNFGYSTDIWGGSVVYSVVKYNTSTHNDDSKVFKYNIADKKTQEIISSEGAPIYYTDIWNKNIVYIMNNKVFLYNLDSKLTKTIDNNDSEKRDVAIYEDKIVWADERDGNFEIYLYDLSTNKEKRLTNTPADDDAPDLYGKVLVYRSNHDWEIRVFELK